MKSDWSAVASPRRRSQRSRRSYSFGDETPILFGSVGFDGSVKFINPAWERLLGYDGEELRRLHLHELVPLRSRRAVDMVHRLLDPTKPGSIAFRLRCKDGTSKLFIWHRRYETEARRMFIAGEEITDRRLPR